MKFQLHDFIKGKITKNCHITNPNGKGYRNALYDFEPGEVYETADPILTAFIKQEGVGDVREKSLSTPDLKEQLEYYHIPYEVHKCGGCTNAKPHLYYNPFKIVEE